MARNECMNAGISAYRPGRHSCLFVYLSVFVLFRHFIFLVVDVDVVVIALFMNENAFIIYCTVCENIISALKHWIL